MPRSNKKKKLDQRAVPTGDKAISHLLNKETTIMIDRAIVSYQIICLKELIISILQASARRHGINLRHGTPNPGLGDCAIEATISNINDRSCYREKFNLSITNCTLNHLFYSTTDIRYCYSIYNS